MRYEPIPCNCGNTIDSHPQCYEKRFQLMNFDGEKEFFMPYHQCKNCHMIAMKQAVMELEDVI